MMSGEAKRFSEHLFDRITEARADAVSVAPTPEENEWRNRWIREAKNGQRSSCWVEEDDPISESHGQMNQFLRSAFPQED
jgi:hypothetical protein